MTIVLWIYLVLFIIGSLLLYGAEILTPKNDRDPILETIGDIVTTLVLLTGMILLLVGNHDLTLKRIWIFAGPSAFILQACLSWAGRSRESGSDKAADVFGDVFSVILLVPALAFNLIYSLS